MGLIFSAGATRFVGSSIATRGNSLNPTFAVSAEVVASRAWSVSFQANRAVAVLSGVSATPSVNDNLEARINGSFHRRLRVALVTAYTRGDAPAGGVVVTSGSNAVTGTLETRYGIASWCGIFGSYSYYHHRVQDASMIASGLPPVYDRQTARIGLTLWLPLYGAF